MSLLSLPSMCYYVLTGVFCRRHSSGEHSLLTQHATISDPLPGINVSLHGHNNDKQLSWTDQLQGIDKMAAADDRVRTGHRALSMQWSDPLTNQPLSYWDLGRCLLCFN